MAMRRYPPGRVPLNFRREVLGALRFIQSLRAFRRARCAVVWSVGWLVGWLAGWLVVVGFQVLGVSKARGSGFGGPRRLPDGFKMTQNIPKTAQNGSKTAQDGLKTAQDSPRTAQDGPKTAQDGSNRWHWSGDRRQSVEVSAAYPCAPEP